MQSTQLGMTFLEFLIASLILATFSGVVAMVMEFTLRFLGNAEKAAGNGILIDHAEAQLSMDRLSKVLSQPGISKDEIVGNMVAKCTKNPAVEWGNLDVLPIPEISVSYTHLTLPTSYAV